MFKKYSVKKKKNHSLRFSKFYASKKFTVYYVVIVYASYVIKMSFLPIIFTKDESNKVQDSDRGLENATF